jgi:hypothetical protein
MSSSDSKQMWQQIKPQAPDCEGNQFADYPRNHDFQTPGENYFDVHFDQDNNVIPDDYQDMHRRGVAGESRYGSLMFADNDGLQNGPGANNVYTPEDAGPSGNLQKIDVDVSRSDRGRES